MLSAPRARESAGPFYRVPGVAKAPFCVGSPNLACYNNSMAIQFGTGPTLKDACPWLRDDVARHERILDVTERNSVIEGLPPFQEETRQRLKAQLEGLAPPAPRPAE